MTESWSHHGVILSHLVIAVMLTYVAAQGDKYLLSTNGASQIWGHKYTVKRNETGLATTATRPRTWVDFDVSLPVGRLIRFYAYINRIDAPSMSNQNQLRFQIWYALNTTQYRLLYEKKVNVSNIEGVIQVDVNQTVYLPSFCRLGWTSDNSIIPISFDFVDRYPLYYRTVDNNDFPVVGSLYTNFYLYPYPAVFSVAVEIDPRLEGATGATGPQGPGGGGNGTGGGGGLGETGATGPVGPPGPAGPPGYSGGENVINIDYSQCWNITSGQSSSTGCSHVQCNNTDASGSVCRCFNGFSLAPDQRTCVDADECAFHNGGCAYNCTNTVGGYYCTCPLGLILAQNQEDCLDINECLTVKCDQVCVNTFGSFVCIKIQNALIPVQGQRLQSSDNQDNINNNNNASINNTATTTGILIWVAILTLSLLILTVAFFYKWRRSSREGPWDVAPDIPSAGSFDGGSEDGGGSTNGAFMDFGNGKFSLSDRTTSQSNRGSRSSVASILSLQGEVNPAADQNSHL